MNTVFYYNGKLFGLRALDEQRSLSRLQFRFGEDSAGTYVEFLGRASKTHKEGLNHRKRSTKSVKQIGRNEEKKCFYDILKRYLEAVPTEATDDADRSVTQIY